MATRDPHPAHLANMTAKALDAIRAIEAFAEILVDLDEAPEVTTKLEGLRWIRRRLAEIEHVEAMWALIAEATGRAGFDTTRGPILRYLARTIADLEATDQGDPFAGLVR